MSSESLQISKLGATVLQFRPQLAYAKFEEVRQNYNLGRKKSLKESVCKLPSSARAADLSHIIVGITDIVRRKELIRAQLGKRTYSRSM